MKSFTLLNLNLLVMAVQLTYASNKNGENNNNNSNKDDTYHHHHTNLHEDGNSGSQN